MLLTVLGANMKWVVPALVKVGFFVALVMIWRFVCYMDDRKKK